MTSTARLAGLLPYGVVCGVAFGLVASCTPPVEPSSAEHPTSVGALACKPRRPLPETCAVPGGGPRFEELPSELGGGPGEAVTPGEMSAGAAEAKRLFDRGLFGHAYRELGLVALGAYGDDRGNREIAEYNLAISAFNLNWYQSAADLFGEVAGRPAHQKHAESILWIMRVVTMGCATRPLVVALASYDTSEITYFDNPQHRHMRNLAAFAAARGKLELGAYDEAEAMFTKLLDVRAHRDAALDCLDVVRAERTSAGAR